MGIRENCKSENNFGKMIYSYTVKEGMGHQIRICSMKIVCTINQVCLKTACITFHKHQNKYSRKTEQEKKETPQNYSDEAFAFLSDDKYL